VRARMTHVATLTWSHAVRRVRLNLDTMAYGLRLLIGVVGAAVLVWMGVQLGAAWQQRHQSQAGAPLVVSTEVVRVP
jgi:threonine/homoserine/homoserine lactone efflux protein